MDKPPYRIFFKQIRDGSADAIRWNGPNSESSRWWGYGIVNCIQVDLERNGMKLRKGGHDILFWSETQGAEASKTFRPMYRTLSVHRNKFLSFCLWEASAKICPKVPLKKHGMYLWASQKFVGQQHLFWCPWEQAHYGSKTAIVGGKLLSFLAACLLSAIFLEKKAAWTIWDARRLSTNFVCVF